MADRLIDGIDRAQAERIAASLEELQLKLQGGALNDYRLAVLCGAAAVRWIGAHAADGVPLDSKASSKPATKE